MTDLYKVGVSLTMATNVPQIMQAMAQQILHVHTNVGQLQGAFDRLRIAVTGAFAVKAGETLISTMAKIIDKTKDLSHELTQLRKLGMNEDQVGAANQLAIGVTRNVRGVTQSGALRMYGEGVNMFGEENMKKLAQPLAKFSQVVGNTTGDYGKASHSMFEMMRAADLLGKFMDQKTHTVDTERLTHFLDVGSKVISGTRGRVDARQWLNMAQQGAPAMSGMTDRGLVETSILAQAMGGFRTGTSLQSMFQQFIGGSTTKRTANALVDMGVITGYEKTGPASVKIRPEHYAEADTQKKLTQSPLDFIGTFIKKMEGQGMNRDEMALQVFNLFGRQTTQKAAHDMIRNFEQMKAESGRIMGGQGVDAAKQTQDTHDIVQAQQNFSAAWTNFLTALAGEDSKAAIGVLNRLTDTLRSMTEVLRGMQPETLENVAKALGVLGATLIVGGAVAIAFGVGGPVTAIAAGLTAVAAAFVAFKPELDKFYGWMDEFSKKWDGWKEANIHGSEGAFGQLIENLKSNWEKTKENFKAIIDGIGNALKAITDKLTGFVESLKGFFNRLGEVTPDPKVWQQNFQGGSGGTGGGLVQKAGWGGGGGAQALGGSERERGMQVMRQMIAAGATPEAAAVAAGNFQWESHFGKVWGDRGASAGLAHWNRPAGRLQQMQRFVGPNWQNDISGQTRFFMHDMRNKYDSSFFQKRDLGALQSTMNRYEGFKGWNSGDKSIPHRMNNARKWLDMWRQQGGRAPATPPPSGEGKAPVIHTAIHLDGRKVAANTTQHQGGFASGPSHGAQAFDGTRQFAGPNQAHLAGNIG